MIFCKRCPQSFESGGVGVEFKDMSAGSSPVSATGHAGTPFIHALSERNLGYYTLVTPFS